MMHANSAGDRHHQRAAAVPQAAPRAAGQTQPAVRGEAQGEGRKTAGPPTPAPRPGPHLQGGDMLIVELVLAVAQHQRGFAHAALPEQHHLEGEAAAPGRRAGPRRHPRPAAEPRLTSTGRTAAPPPPTGTRARRGEGPAGMGRHRRGRGDRGWRETRQQNVPGGRKPPLPLMAASSSYVTHRPVTRSPRRQWEGGKRRRWEAPPSPRLLGGSRGGACAGRGRGPGQGSRAREDLSVNLLPRVPPAAHEPRDTESPLINTDSINAVLYEKEKRKEQNASRRTRTGFPGVRSLVTEQYYIHTE
ncbi:uncharacterized protein GJ701_003907 [Geothlypis trichas]